MVLWSKLDVDWTAEYINPWEDKDNLYLSLDYLENYAVSKQELIILLFTKIEIIYSLLAEFEMNIIIEYGDSQSIWIH